ncbi:MAG: type II toxin-antitoxin system VapB family antitoxin [Thermodesulfovibrionales bacterium]
MKTTIDIPNKDLEEVIKYTKAKTKRDAVLQAIRDFNKRKRLSELAEILGTFKEFMTQDDLEKMREDRKWKKIK